MLFKEIYGGIGAVLLLLSCAPYFIGMLKGQIKPHVFTWALWALLNAIVFGAQVTENAGAGAWTAGVTTLANTVIALYALKFGEKNITRSDWVIFIAAGSAIPLWILMDDPLWSVILVSVIDALAFFPTFRKSWHKPFEEATLTFAMGAAGFCFSIAALETYSMTNYLYPVAVIGLNIAFISMVLWRRKTIKKEKA